MNNFEQLYDELKETMLMKHWQYMKYRNVKVCITIIFCQSF